jgi:hypothetical protein
LIKTKKRIHKRFHLQGYRPRSPCVNRCFAEKCSIHLQVRHSTKQEASGQQKTDHMPYVGFVFNWLSVLKMESTRSFETSVHTRAIRNHISEDGNKHNYRCENLRSYKWPVSLQIHVTLFCWGFRCWKFVTALRSNKTQERGTEETNIRWQEQMRHSWRVGGNGNATVSKQAGSLTRSINHSGHHMNMDDRILLQKFVAPNTSPYLWNAVFWADTLRVTTNGSKSTGESFEFVFYPLNLVIFYSEARCHHITTSTTLINITAFDRV